MITFYAGVLESRDQRFRLTWNEARCLAEAIHSAMERRPAHVGAWGWVVRSFRDKSVVIERPGFSARLTWMQATYLGVCLATVPRLRLVKGAA